MSQRGSSSAGPVLGIAASVILVGTVAASWIDQPAARSIGDVAVTEVRPTPGLELSPVAFVAALGGLLCSVALLAARGAVRRIVSLLLVVVGVGAIAATGVGVSRMLALDGGVTIAPWGAALASCGLLAAGLLGFGRPGRRLPARYDVDVSPEDSEWRIASDPADPQGDEPEGYPEPRA